MNALSRSLVRSVVALLASLLMGEAVLAQVPDRVGRVAYLAGDVQFYSESAQAWLPAQLNAPVSSRNSLFTGPDGRAEIRFGSTAVALDAGTQLDIHTLDDTRFKAGVTRGSISVRVPRIEDDESYEVAAPAATYAILQAGRYRVDAADDRSSVTVLAGLVSASVVGSVAAMVDAGQSLSAMSGSFLRSAGRPGTLDLWGEQRDVAYRTSQSARYVSPNMTGYEELDANGRWASDPDYGNVWYPTKYVSADWVPYRDGRWAYVAPWGWTWIDAAPWGFAPFHYGRWVMVGSRWGWMPGAYVRRPSYAPALVGFIGGSAGGNVALSISIASRPSVGWYPLPPWERYRPAYDHHDRHAQNINNFRMSQAPSSAWRTVDRQQVSANLAQGATVVPREAFAESRPVRRAALAVSAPELVAPAAVATPVAAPVSMRAAAPVVARPEPGDRRSGREQDSGRTERGRGGVDEGKRPVQPSPVVEAAPVLQQATPIVTSSGPRIFRSETRESQRQTPAATVVPSAREAASTQPAQAAPDLRVGASNGERWGTRRAENRSEERPTQRPATVVPQVTQPAQPSGGKLPAVAVAEQVTPVRSEPAPVVTSPVQRQTQPAAPLPERSGESNLRYESGSRERAPTTVVSPAPQARPPAPQPVVAAPAVRPEPRVEQRVEVRAAPRVEPRIEARVEPRMELRTEARPEPRPEPRQMQRSEPPPQARATAPQSQPEQKRAPEPERERRQHGDRDKDKDKSK